MTDRAIAASERKVGRLIAVTALLVLALIIAGYALS
jgi:hypothetical protein